MTKVDDQLMSVVWCVVDDDYVSLEFASIAVTKSERGKPEIGLGREY